MNLKIGLKKIYQKVLNYPMITSILFGSYFVVQKVKNKECRSGMKKISSFQKQDNTQRKTLKAVKVAAVCDDMTWENLKQECEVYSLTPRNWKQTFIEQCPDVFFCESAWLGIKQQGECWHGRIYRNHKLLFENRKTLFEILEFCKVYQIPTVFWNKEDPAFFENEKYDFKDTALKFDYIVTTAKECVEKYKAFGHSNVRVMPFGFSPYLFHPLNCYPKEEKAVFAGSWYAEEKERCQALEQIFDMVLEKGIPLIIYDRQTGTTKEGRQYPEKYQKYVHPAIPFEKLGVELKKAKYAINVNTVVDSETMFARRVLEFMAMNTIVISNESIGMRKKFLHRVWFVGEKFSEENVQRDCLNNMEYVFEYRSNEKLLTELMQWIGVLKETKLPLIAVVVPEEKKEKFLYLEAQKKQENVQIKVVTIKEVITEKKAIYSYGCLLGEGMDCPNFKRLLLHSCYLPIDCGIKETKCMNFTIQEDIDNENVLFRWETFCSVLEQPSRKRKKYLLGTSTPT